MNEHERVIASLEDGLFAVFPPDSVVRRAMVRAKLAHQGQTRKGGAPYIVHPYRVAAMVREMGEIAASVAVLHDALEDTEINPNDICGLGDSVLMGVWWLTSPATGELKRLPRDRRKLMQREKIAAAPAWVQAIKVADRLDNLTDGGLDEDFLHLYVEESRALMQAIDYGGIAAKMLEANDPDSLLTFLGLRRKLWARIGELDGLPVPR